jgi:hypothetical protein
MLAADYRVVAPDGLVEGNPYGEWISRYWQWLISIPREHNPLFDSTGKDAQTQQMGRVFFLVNAPENSTVERKCTITDDKILFIPINTSLFTSIEYPKDVSQQLRMKAMRQERTQVSEIGLTIDKKPAIPNIMDFMMGSPLFNLHLREDNILGINVETGKVISTIGISEGYWVMIYGLPPVREPKVIHFKAKGTYDSETEMGIPFETDVKYELIIQKYSEKVTTIEISGSMERQNTTNK